MTCFWRDMDVDVSAKALFPFALTVFTSCVVFIVNDPLH